MASDAFSGAVEGPYLTDQSPYWRVTVVRVDGSRRWSSLRTKDEEAAKQMVAKMRGRHAAPAFWSEHGTDGKEGTGQ